MFNKFDSLKINISKINQEKINLSEWKEFKISEIFEVSKYGNIAYAYTYKSGKTPFISARTDNNGLNGWITIKNNSEINKGNCISVSIDGIYSGKTFYQDIDFARTTNLAVLRNDNLNKYNALFLSTIIEKKLMSSFDYNRKLKSQDLLKNTKILIPALSKNNEITPDWEYMEKMIKEIYLKLFN